MSYNITFNITPCYKCVKKMLKSSQDPLLLLMQHIYDNSFNKITKYIIRKYNSSDFYKRHDYVMTDTCSNEKLGIYLLKKYNVLTLKYSMFTIILTKLGLNLYTKSSLRYHQYKYFDLFLQTLI